MKQTIVKNFNQIDKKAKLLQERVGHLDVLKVVFKFYNSENDKEKKQWYYDYAKWLGNLSLTLKKEIENI